MDENYLHPEGPQLDSGLFSVASSNLVVSDFIQGILHNHFTNRGGSHGNYAVLMLTWTSYSLMTVNSDIIKQNLLQSFLSIRHSRDKMCQTPQSCMERNNVIYRETDM